MKNLPNELLKEIAENFDYNKFYKNKNILLVSASLSFFLKQHIVPIKIKKSQQVIN